MNYRVGYNQTTFVTDGDKADPSIIAGVNVNMMQPLWKTVWQFFKMLNIELLHDPVIPGIHFMEIRVYGHAKT